jgi:hypothetical protein
MTLTFDWLTHPFALGFYVGLVPVIFYRVQLYLARRDLRSRESAQLLQVAALTEVVQKMQQDAKAGGTEMENLRVKVQSLMQKPEQQRLRQLDVMIRAEQRLTVTAPGFAPAWQTAKNEALSQLEEEERGKSAPRQMFAQIVSGGAAMLDRLRSAGPSEKGAVDSKSDAPQN